MTIDFHAHILPGLDYSSKDILTSLTHICAAKKAGVDVIAATSHFYPTVDTIGDFLVCRQKSWDRLRSLLPADAPVIIPAAEVLIYDGIDKMEGLQSLCFRGMSTILLEMPPTDWKNGIYETIERINDLTGGCAVIAHVDRYDPDIVDSLFEIGVTGQINADALIRLAGSEKLINWIDSGKISAIGSDINGAHNAYRPFLKAREALGPRFERIMMRSRDLLRSDRHVFIR